MPDPDHPGSDLLLLDSRQDLTDDLGVRDVDDGLGEEVRERRRDGENHLVGTGSALRGPDLGEAHRPLRVAGGARHGHSTSNSGFDALVTCRSFFISSHRAPDGRGLQQVTGDPLTQHGQQVGGDIGETGRLERLHQIQAGDAAVHDLLGTLEVLQHVAGQQVGRAVGVHRCVDLRVGDRRQIQVVEHRLQGFGGPGAHGEDVVLLDVAQAAVDLQIALNGVEVVEVVAVDVGAGEHVVVVGCRGVSGADEVGAGHHLRHQPGGAAHRRMRERLVVARGAFQVDCRGDHVLGSHRADSGRNRARHADAGDRAVLQPLHTGALGDQDAADLQVQHRLALGVTHLHLRAGARGEPHLDAPGGVGRGQERLRPGGVVTVDEHRFGAVHRDRLGIGGDAAHAEFEFGGLFEGTLGQRHALADLAADL